MLFPDINVLVYAYNLAAPEHLACKKWLESALNANKPVCFSWHTIMGFVRIVTTVRMVPAALTAKEAMEIADELMQSPVSRMLLPGDGHFEIFRKLVNDTGISGARLSDAHLASLAMEYGATMVSADRDFRIFDDLKLINPLAAN